MPDILLHVCCACCATHCIEALKAEGLDVTLFFSNSNIYPKEEYKKRLENAKKVAKLMDVQIMIDDYNHEEWLKNIKGLEKEPEKGKRCERCFEFNLKRTADYAAKNNIYHFTTTLTVSPHKNSKLIFKIGKSIADEFLDLDFKKKDGFKKSLELSKDLNLYRQNYCGCEFSNKQASPKE